MRDRIGSINALGMLQPHIGKSGLVPIHNFGRGGQREAVEWVPGTEEVAAAAWQG